MLKFDEKTYETKRLKTRKVSSVFFLIFLLTGQYEFKSNCILLQIRNLHFAKFTVKISFINLFNGIKGIWKYVLVQKITFKEFLLTFTEYEKKVFKKII